MRTAPVHQEALPMETTSSVLDAIRTNWTREQLEDEITRLDKAVDEHTREEQRHREARTEAERDLALLRQLHAYVGGSAIAVTARATLTVDGERGGPTRKNVPKREPILQIMREQESGAPDGEVWTPPMMRRALEARGIEGSTTLVRTTMRRMARSGQLKVHDDGGYMLPD